MALIQRRQFLYGATGLSLVAALEPLFGRSKMSAVGQGYTSSGEIRLNILLHGMFAIIIEPDFNGGKEVTVLPPHVVGVKPGATPHVYLATDMKGSPVSFEWLKRGSDYSFTFGGEEVRPFIDVKTHAVISLGNNQGDIQRNSGVAPHCSITLPFPRRIIPLRSVTPLDGTQNLFSDPTGLIAQPSQIPLVTMLQYVIGTTGVGPDINSNYHIFAEPQECTPDFHVTEAFDTLKSLFTNLNHLTFNSALTPKHLTNATEPAGAGVTTPEEQAIVELDGLNCTDNGGMSGGDHLGIHPTSCMSLLALNS
jgi:hypothetical protein